MILTRLIDFGEDPVTALTGPRFLLGKTFSDSHDSLKLEIDAGDAVFAALAERGHILSPIDRQSPLAGQAGIIARQTDGSLAGAHDPRGGRGRIARRIDVMTSFG
jgi:gamma-glutamyltranspeptidase/glutathione hydrolase